MLQRLRMGLAKVKSGNTSENQVNEIQAMIQWCGDTFALDLLICY